MCQFYLIHNFIFFSLGQSCMPIVKVTIVTLCTASGISQIFTVNNLNQKKKNRDIVTSKK